VAMVWGIIAATKQQRAQYGVSKFRIILRPLTQHLAFPPDLIGGHPLPASGERVPSRIAARRVRGISDSVHLMSSMESLL
jgi:hypothetical protein